MGYIIIKDGGQTKTLTAKTAEPTTKPYIRTKDGYFPLTTNTSTGLELRCKAGRSVYKVVETYSTSIETTTTVSDTSTRSSRINIDDNKTYGTFYKTESWIFDTGGYYRETSQRIYITATPDALKKWKAQITFTMQTKTGTFKGLNSRTSSTGSNMHVFSSYDYGTTTYWDVRTYYVYSNAAMVSLASERVTNFTATMTWDYKALSTHPQYSAITYSRTSSSFSNKFDVISGKQTTDWKSFGSTTAGLATETGYLAIPFNVRYSLTTTTSSSKTTTISTTSQ